MSRETGRQAISQRLLGLDALRGFAILTMVLSGAIPFGVLPVWMYHAQVPPPGHIFNPGIPGITWVDLVFPFFLFALGAAIPIAMQRRLDSEVPVYKAVVSIFERFVLLGFFAIFSHHLRPFILGDPQSVQTSLIALLGFTVLFIIFVRLPESWSRTRKFSVKMTGWIAAVVVLAFLRYHDGSGFSIHRSDIIIVVLANMALFGGLIWLATRGKVMVRLGVLALFLAFRLSAQESGWVEAVWNFTPLPWIYHFRYLQYLLIVIPGTIVGEIFYNWLKSIRNEGIGENPWPRSYLIGIIALMLAFHGLMLVGLFERWVTETVILSVVMISVGYVLFRNPVNETGRVLQQLFYIGSFCILLGLAFEPYEGGIRKDHATVSYYFITSGLATYLLIAFTIIIDIFKTRKVVSLLVYAGQNPMMAYVALSNLIMPVFIITGADSVFRSITQTPWLGALRAGVYVLILAYVVGWFARRKVFWRA
jgi:predicted acyltransferase